MHRMWVTALLNVAVVTLPAAESPWLMPLAGDIIRGRTQCGAWSSAGLAMCIALNLAGMQSDKRIQAKWQEWGNVSPKEQGGCSYFNSLASNKAAERFSRASERAMLSPKEFILYQGGLRRGAHLNGAGVLLLPLQSRWSVRLFPVCHRGLTVSRQRKDYAAVTNISCYYCDAENPRDAQQNLKHNTCANRHAPARRPGQSRWIGWRCPCPWAAHEGCGGAGRLPTRLAKAGRDRGQPAAQGWARSAGQDDLWANPRPAALWLWGSRCRQGLFRCREGPRGTDGALGVLRAPRGAAKGAAGARECWRGPWGSEETTTGCWQGTPGGIGGGGGACRAEGWALTAAGRRGDPGGHGGGVGSSAGPGVLPRRRAGPRRGRRGPRGAGGAGAGRSPRPRRPRARRSRRCP